MPNDQHLIERGRSNTEKLKRSTLTNDNNLEVINNTPLENDKRRDSNDLLFYDNDQSV